MDPIAILRSKLHNLSVIKFKIVVGPHTGDVFHAAPKTRHAVAPQWRVGTATKLCAWRVEVSHCSHQHQSNTSYRKTQPTNTRVALIRLVCIVLAYGGREKERMGLEPAMTIQHMAVQNCGRGRNTLAAQQWCEVMTTITFLQQH